MNMRTLGKAILGMVGALWLAGCAMEVASDEQKAPEYQGIVIRENPCAVTLCPSETQCLVQDGQAVCVPRGSEQCGETVCAPGTDCCNPLLGICLPPGRVCIF
jgi:hypothetical protein